MIGNLDRHLDFGWPCVSEPTISITGQTSQTRTVIFIERARVLKKARNLFWDIHDVSIETPLLTDTSDEALIAEVRRRKLRVAKTRRKRRKR